MSPKRGSRGGSTIANKPYNPYSNYSEKSNQPLSKYSLLCTAWPQQECRLGYLETANAREMQKCYVGKDAK